MSNKDKVVSFRQRRKNNLVKFLGNKCCLCGYKKSNAALEFHHLDPKSKKYQLSSGNCHNIQEDIEEAKKCILVCSNCHREIHEGLYQNEDLTKYQNFDEEIEKLLLKTEDKYYCSKCRIEITKYSKSGMCHKCISSVKQKVQNLPSREELKELIKNKSFVEIGKDYNVSDNAIRKWCKNYNLPSTKREINSFTEDQWAKI